MSLVFRVDAARERLSQKRLGEIDINHEEATSRKPHVNASSSQSTRDVTRTVQPVQQDHYIIPPGLLLRNLI